MDIVWLITNSGDSRCINGCLAALARRDSILRGRSYVASQGRCGGRDGRVAIEFDHDTIWLGGYAVT